MALLFIVSLCCWNQSSVL